MEDIEEMQAFLGELGSSKVDRRLRNRLTTILNALQGMTEEEKERIVELDEARFARENPEYLSVSQQWGRNYEKWL